MTHGCVESKKWCFIAYAVVLLSGGLSERIGGV